MISKINKYINSWKQKGYPSDIPDECPKELESLKIVPSYRMIAMCLLKNDHSLKGLGLSTKKSSWYNFYKKIELENRKYK